MEFWFHCNLCIRFPDTISEVRNYHLNSCGHIFCNACFRTIGNTKVCKICDHKGIQTRPMSSKLPFYIMKLLYPVKILIEDAEKYIRQVVHFQNSQKKLIERHLIEKGIQIQQQLQEIRDSVEQRRHLEREIAYIELGLRRLKDDIDSTLIRYKDFENKVLKAKIALFEYEQISKNEESLQSSAISDQPLDLSKKAHNTSKNLSDMGKMNFGITTDNIRKSVPVQVYRAPQFGAQNFHPQRVQINSYGIGNSPRGNRKRHFVEERTSGVTANPVLAKFAAIGDQNINVDESRNFMG